MRCYSSAAAESRFIRRFRDPQKGQESPFLQVTDEGTRKEIPEDKAALPMEELYIILTTRKTKGHLGEEEGTAGPFEAVPHGSSVPLAD